MTQIELNRILGRVQLMKGLYENANIWEELANCGFADFLKPYVEENWESLEYEKIDLMIEAHSLTALPDWSQIEINFTALVERARING